MPGFLLHANAFVMCAHGGQAQPMVPFPRVTVSGNAIATMASPHAITGCPFVPTGGNGPCVTAQWLVGIFSLIPALSGLSILGLYGLYLLYLGLPVVMKVPAEKAMSYTVAVVVAVILVFIVIGVVSGIVIGTAAFVTL